MLINIVIPAIAESVTTGVVTRIHKKQGEGVTKDEVLLDIETDKITFELPSPSIGAIAQWTIKEGDTVNVGQVVGTIDDKATGTVSAAAPAAKAAGSSATAVAPPPARATTAAAAASNGHAGDDIRATPLARKVATEHNVDLGKIAPTGPGNRVREQDVVAFVESKKADSGAKKPGVPSSSGDSRGSRGVTRERMTPLRQRIASRLVQAQHTAAMLTTFNEVDMSAVMALRKQHKEDFEKKHGIGLGFMSFFVKSVVGALRAFPLVNAAIVEGEDGQAAIEKHDYCDIAVAVSTPKGLVVPVLRNCESRSFAQIEAGIKDLADRGRDGKLSLDEMQGGTFTITNGGVFGSLMSTPILNPPQSAILGMHTIKGRAVEFPVGSGQVAIRPMMYLALSYDHRIIDGSEAVQFLVRIKNAIEDPSRLLLEL